MPYRRLSLRCLSTCLSALLSVLLIIITAGPGLAATRTWTGTMSTGWSDDGAGGNWNDEAAPVAGDVVRYDSSSIANLSQNNDISGLSLGGITLWSSLANDVAISGNALTLTGNINDYGSGQNLTINNDITLGSGIAVSTYSASQITLNGNITGGANNLYYTANVAGGVFVLGGSKSGTGGFDCGSSSGCTCIVSAAQNYTGSTRILYNATLQLAAGGGLPDTGYVLLNNTGSTLDLNGISDTIGSLAGDGPVLLGGGTLTLGGDNSASMNLSGVISENGNIVKEGTGILWLGGANTFNGSLTINNGAVRISDAAERIPNNTAVVLNAGTFGTGGYEETIGSLSGAAGTVVELGGTATLTTGGNNASTTYAGRMIYGGSLAKEGTGTFTLSGANTYTGTTTINGGTLRLGAANSLNSFSSMVVASGATFDLNGFNQTIANLSGSGTVSTGIGVLTITNSLSPGTSPGVITFQGGFSLAIGTLNVEIDGTNPGVDYDQVNVFGSVSLGGNLNLIPSFSPAGGTAFTIINNDGVDAVTGTFAGLAEGATITAGGTTYRISYAGGDGNDVTLTALASGGGGGGGNDTEPEPAPNTPPAPSVPQGSGPNPTGSLDGSTLSWPQVKGATYYRIYRADCPLCPRKEIGRTTENSFVDNTAIPGQPYTYWLRAENNDGLGGYSNWMAAWRYEQNPGRAGDFNGDGVMDLLWWDRDTGQVYIWFMNGGQVMNVSAPMEGLDVSQWLLIGTGDFNGDGACDLLWWKPETGEILFWYMQPSMAAAESALFQAMSDPITQTMPGHAALSYPGDLNGDGFGDILWRNYSTGEVTIWLMGADGKPMYSGPPVPADETIIRGERPGLSGTLQWQVAGLADANGDGKADVIWQDERNNRLVTWLMDGSDITQAIDETKGLDTVWRLVGLGDLNMDGQADIVWRNEASGEIKAWLMQAGKFSEERTIVPGSAEATQWQVKAVGDFCEPGCDDVYCKHSESSAVKIVTLEGEEFTPSVE